MLSYQNSYQNSGSKEVLAGTFIEKTDIEPVIIEGDFADQGVEGHSVDIRPEFPNEGIRCGALHITIIDGIGFEGEFQVMGHHQAPVFIDLLAGSEEEAVVMYEASALDIGLNPPDDGVLERIAQAPAPLDLLEHLLGIAGNRRVIIHRSKIITDKVVIIIGHKRPHLSTLPDPPLRTLH